MIKQVENFMKIFNLDNVSLLRATYFNKELSEKIYTQIINIVINNFDELDLDSCDYLFYALSYCNVSDEMKYRAKRLLAIKMLLIYDQLYLVDYGLPIERHFSDRFVNLLYNEVEKLKGGDFTVDKEEMKNKLLTEIIDDEVENFIPVKTEVRETETKNELLEKMIEEHNHWARIFEYLIYKLSQHNIIDIDKLSQYMNGAPLNEVEGIPEMESDNTEEEIDKMLNKLNEEGDE